MISVGNILKIVDRTTGSGVLNNPEVLQVAEAGLTPLLAAGDLLIRRFEYDPCTAFCPPRAGSVITSRAHGLGQMMSPVALTLAIMARREPEQCAKPNWRFIARSTIYDPAGNMVSMKHGNNVTSWGCGMFGHGAG